MGLYWVSGHAGVRGKEIANELARGGSVLGFLGPEPTLGVPRRDIQKEPSRWLINQHWGRWRGLGGTQRQAWEPISGPSPGVKAKFLSFNRTQSRTISDLLTGHNTLRRHLYPLELLDSPLCRRCGVREETRPTFFVNVRLWPHSDTHIWAPFSWSRRILRV